MSAQTDGIRVQCVPGSDVYGSKRNRLISEPCLPRGKFESTIRSGARSRGMTKQLWTVDKIEVDVSGHFTTHHYLRTKSGDLGEITFAAFAREAIYRAPDGRELQMQQAHWLGSS